MLAKSHDPMCSKVNQRVEVTNPLLKDSHRNECQKLKILKARGFKWCSETVALLLFPTVFSLKFQTGECGLHEALCIQSGLISNVNDDMRWPKPQPVSDYLRTLFHISCWWSWSIWKPQRSTSGWMAINTHISIYKETSKRNTLRILFACQGVGSSNI